MPRYWIKLIVGPVVAEIVAILILVCLVATFGPNDAGGAQLYAKKLGRWVGPLTGIVFSFLGALWIARSLATSRVLYGALFGVVMALIDVALLIAMRASFDWIFVVSNGGKIIAAIAGGLCAKQMSS
jgi:hypothetical protein